VRDLENRPKNLKSLCLGPYVTLYFPGFLFSVVGYSAKKNKKIKIKKLIWIASLFICLALKGFLEL
jgi:hypothetical protein